MAVLRQQLSPDDHMPVLNLGQPRIDPLLARVRLGGRENTVKESRVRFVLPMVFEGVKIRLVTRSARGSTVVAIGQICPGRPPSAPATLSGRPLSYDYETPSSGDTAMRIILSIFTGAAAVCAGVLEAQEPRTPAPPRRPAPIRAPAPECVTTDGKTECRIIRSSLMDSALIKRAALGIQLGSTGSVRDTLGVFVSHVTPKGPAETAGIIEVTG